VSRAATARRIEPTDDASTTAAPGPASGAPPAPVAPVAALAGSPVAGIVAGNAVALAGVLVGHWPVLPVLLVFWGQSVAIGAAAVIRMHRLRRFTAAGLTMSHRAVPETPAAARRAARFFALHFGLFHLVYAGFLLGGRFGRVPAGSAAAIAVNVLVFAFVPLRRALAARDDDRGRPDLGTLMFAPYLRVVPMHVAILLGAAFPQGMMPAFVLLKTAADLGMHAIERRTARTAGA
jgi:hypothetical protein